MHLNTSLCFKKTNRDERYALIDGWAATHTFCAYLHFVVQALAWRQKNEGLQDAKHDGFTISRSIHLPAFASMSTSRAHVLLSPKHGVV
jgi:hypothetical protein